MLLIRSENPRRRQAENPLISLSEFAGPALRERGVTVAQACRDLEVHENVLRRWVRELTADPTQAFPGHGQQKPEQLEIERLRREVAKLRAERDILKKAAAFFAREAK
jgi:transposase